MSLKMLSDYILIKLNEADTLSSGGIAIVKTEQPCVGTVISADPGKYNVTGKFEECPLEGGETVIFGKASLNQELVHEGETFHVMRYEDLFAISK